MERKLIAGVFVLAATAISLPGLAQIEITPKTTKNSTVKKEGFAVPQPDNPAPNPTAVTYPGMSRYVDLKGFFSVLLCGTPDKDGALVLSGANYTCVSEKDKQGVWSVNFADIQELGAPPYDSKKQSAVIQQHTQTFIERIHGKMNSLKAHAKFGYQFRDISGRIDGGPHSGGRFRINAYLSGKRIFIVSAEGKESWVKSPQVEAFFSSFEIPGATSVPKLKVE